MNGETDPAFLGGEKSKYFQNNYMSSDLEDKKFVFKEDVENVQW